MKHNKVKQPWKVRLVTFLVETVFNIVIIGLFMGVASVFFAKSAFITVVIGDSMEPTLHSFQIMFADTFGEIERGDIVTARSPHDGRVVIKRVIGMPGEAVLISPAGVFINGELLEEAYLTDEGRLSTCEQNKMYAVLLEEDQYYLMGDNRAVSYDSRSYGAVSSDRILNEQQETPDWIFVVKSIILLTLGYLLFNPVYIRGKILSDRIRNGILIRSGFVKVVCHADVSVDEQE